MSFSEPYTFKRVDIKANKEKIESKDNNKKHSNFIPQASLLNVRV